MDSSRAPSIAFTKSYLIINTSRVNSATFTRRCIIFLDPDQKGQVLFQGIHANVLAGQTTFSIQNDLIRTKSNAHAAL